MKAQQLSIDITLDKITEFCQRHQIRKISLFGSVLRDNVSADSEIDILIELLPGKSIGLFGLAGWEIDLTEIMGRKVDLRFPEELSHYFRQKVLDSAQVIYVHRCRCRGR